MSEKKERKKKLVVIKDGNEYYTSNYFAEQVVLNERSSREFLTSYQEVKGSKNPKLYTKRTMTQALDDYTNKIGASNIEKRILKQEEERAKKEWELHINTNPEDYLVEQSTREQKEIHNNGVETFDKKLVPTMLHGIYAILGYRFDEEQFRKDCETFENYAYIRQVGEPRELEDIQADRRLNNIFEYIKKE